MSSILGGRFKPGYSPLGSVRRNALLRNQGMDYAGREALSGAVTPTALAPDYAGGLGGSRYLGDVRGRLRDIAERRDNLADAHALEYARMERADRQQAFQNQLAMDERDYRRQRDAAGDQYRNALLQTRTAPKAAKPPITGSLFAHYTPESIQAFNESGGTDYTALKPIDKSDPIKIEQAFKSAREPKLRNYVDNYGFEIKGMGGVQAYNEAMKNYKKELADYLSKKGFAPPANYQSSPLAAPPSTIPEPKMTPVPATPKTTIWGKLFGTQNAGASEVPPGYKYSNSEMQTPLVAPPTAQAPVATQPAPRPTLISDATATSLVRKASNALAPYVGGDNLNDYYDAMEGKTLPLGNPLAWNQNHVSLDSADYARTVQPRESMMTGRVTESSLKLPGQNANLRSFYPGMPTETNGNVSGESYFQKPDESSPLSGEPQNKPGNIAKQKLDIVRGVRSALVQPPTTYDMGGISPTVNDTTEQNTAPIPASALVQSQGVRDDLNNVHSTPAPVVPGFPKPNPLALQPGQTDARRYVDLEPKPPQAPPERMIRLNDQATVPESAITNMDFESNVRELMARRPHLTREQAMQFVMQSMS